LEPQQTLEGKQLFFAFVGLSLNLVYSLCRVILMRMAGERVIQRLRNRIFENIMKQDVAFFGNAATSRRFQS
jgi:ABC-type multidrug transport system fused ATPase/permease subunit